MLMSPTDFSESTVGQVLLGRFPCTLVAYFTNPHFSPNFFYLLSPSGLLSAHVLSAMSVTIALHAWSTGRLSFPLHDLPNTHVLCGAVFSAGTQHKQPDQDRCLQFLWYHRITNQ